MPQYDALSDPALGKFWAKKFGWTIAAPDHLGPHHSPGGRGGGGGGGGGHLGEIEYAVTVYTDSERDAGSTTAKYITLHGKLGSSAELLLDGPTYATARDTCHTFYISTPKVGVLRSITMRNAARSEADAWKCEAVEVKPVHKAKNYTFACGRWLTVDQGGGESATTLSLYNDGGDANTNGPFTQQKTEYQLTVVTGNRANAGTKDEVFAQLSGTRGRSKLEKLQGIHHRPFERGGTYTFVLNVQDVGTLQKLHIQRAGKESSGWFLEVVTVLNMHTDDTTVFKCSDWLSHTEGKNPSMSKELVADAAVGAAGETEFDIMVHTADERYAGTAAKISVVLYGSGGEHGELCGGTE